MVEAVLNPDGIIVFSLPMSPVGIAENSIVPMNKWITDTHIIYEKEKYSYFVCGLKRNKT